MLQAGGHFPFYTAYQHEGTEALWGHLCTADVNVCQVRQVNQYILHLPLGHCELFEQHALLLEHSPTKHLGVIQGLQEMYPPQLSDKIPHSPGLHDVLQSSPPSPSPSTTPQTPVVTHRLEIPEPHLRRPPEGEVPRHTWRVAVHEFEQGRLSVAPLRQLTEQVTDDVALAVATRRTTRKT